MLRMNLSTRPFYNERAAQFVLGAVALLIAALTVFNVMQYRSLSVRHTQLLGQVEDAERRATTLRGDAERARQNVNRAQLSTVAAAAREANDLIDQRAFSWTELLNRLEATLPADVRIQSIRPSTDRHGNMTVTMLVLGRRAEDIEQFVEQLETTGAFRHLYSRTETTNPEGLLEATLEGWYLVETAVPAPKPRPARKD
jgi:Tfp pilus assembly protein PilN